MTKEHNVPASEVVPHKNIPVYTAEVIPDRAKKDGLREDEKVQKDGSLSWCSARFCQKVKKVVIFSSRARITRKDKTGPGSSCTSTFRLIIGGLGPGCHQSCRNHYARAKNSRIKEESLRAREGALRLPWLADRQLAARRRARTGVIARPSPGEPPPSREAWTTCRSRSSTLGRVDQAGSRRATREGLGPPARVPSGRWVRRARRQS